MMVEYKLTRSEQIESSRLRRQFFHRFHPVAARWIYGITIPALAGFLWFDYERHLREWKSAGIVTPGVGQYLDLLLPLVGPLLIYPFISMFDFGGNCRVEIEPMEVRMTLKRIGKKPVTIPWSSIVLLEENDHFICIGSAGIGEIIPKRAFPTTHAAMSFLEQAQAYWHAAIGAPAIEETSAWPPAPRG